MGQAHNSKGIAIPPEYIAVYIVAALDEVKASIAASAASVAVFIVSGRVRLVPTNTELFQQVAVTHGHLMLGIYDKSVPDDWLLKDLNHAEQEFYHGNYQSV